MFIKQLSVFVENKAGRLAQITEELAANGINIHALSIADTTDFGVLRLITSDQAKAEKILKDNGLAVKMTDVVAVALEHKPGGLTSVLKKLEGLNVSIEYMYAFTGRSAKYDALVIFKLSDQDAAAKKLGSAGIVTLGEDVIKELNA